MGLHGDMSIEVVQRAVSLLAAIPTTLVHALNFLVTSTGSLVLLGTRDRNERVYLVAKLVRTSLGRGRTRRRGEDVTGGSQRTGAVLTVAGPVGSGLRIGRVLVGMRHISRRRAVGRVLAVCVGRTRRRYGRIACLLRHASAASVVVASWMV